MISQHSDTEMECAHHEKDADTS